MFPVVTPSLLGVWTFFSDEFEVDLVIGTPPQRASVILDTGSGVALACGTQEEECHPMD